MGHAGQTCESPHDRSAAARRPHTRPLLLHLQYSAFPPSSYPFLASSSYLYPPTTSSPPVPLTYTLPPTPVPLQNIVVYSWLSRVCYLYNDQQYTVHCLAAKVVMHFTVGMQKITGKILCQS